MDKHAYLIMAHNNFYILEKLLLLLDDSRNDIFIHIDKKVKDFDFSYFNALCLKSNIVFTKKRINVKWGTQSQIKNEMNLFETAYKYNPSGYKYYHLISGVDLPIKSQDYIHSYFRDKTATYLHFTDTPSVYDRQRISRYRVKISNKKLRDWFYILQNKFNIDRLKKSKYEIQKGYNWASLTSDAVKVLLNNKKDIYKLTFCSLCADEVYKQIILDYNNVNIYKNPDGKTDDLRFVDWERGDANHPHIFNKDDFELLINSDKLFARKFDTQTDKEIIDKIFDYVMEKDGRKV